MVLHVAFCAKAVRVCARLAALCTNAPAVAVMDNCDAHIATAANTANEIATDAATPWTFYIGSHGRHLTPSPRMGPSAARLHLIVRAANANTRLVSGNMKVCSSVRGRRSGPRRGAGAVEIRRAHPPVKSHIARDVVCGIPRGDGARSARERRSHTQIRLEIRLEFRSAGQP
jgi:hypothetical protein